MKKDRLDRILKELKWSFSKSSGAGGQHVNTTDSKVQAQWLFLQSPLLNSEEKKQIQKNLKNYLNKDRSLLKLSASVHRSREQNRKEVLKKLTYLLEHKAFFKPKNRKATKPTKASIQRRLESKKKTSQVKKDRQKVKF